MTLSTYALETSSVFASVEGVVDENFWAGTCCVGAGDDFVALVKVPVGKSSAWAALRLAVEFLGDFDGA
jgi:hypothetical protein